MTEQEMQLPSISSAHRIEECPASEVLWFHANRSGPPAERGTAIHGFIADVIDRKIPVKIALNRVSLEYRHTCAKLDLPSLVGDLKDYRLEVAYALDLESETVRELGQYLGRDYPDTLPSEVRGTLDVEGVTASGELVVEDYKTGSNVGPPEENWQLRFFATCLMLTRGVAKVLGAITYIRDDGSIEKESHLFHAEELLGTFDELRRLRANLSAAHRLYRETGRVVASPGDHCKYCPSFDVCPAQMSLARMMVRRIRDLDSFLTPTQAEVGQDIAEAWEEYSLIEPVFKRIETYLKDIARNRGFDLADGRRVRGVEFKKANFSQRKVLQLLESYGVSEEEIAACAPQGRGVAARVLKALDG